jgi:hypothetical protein
MAVKRLFDAFFVGRATLLHQLDNRNDWEMLIMKDYVVNYRIYIMNFFHLLIKAG